MSCHISGPYLPVGDTDWVCKIHGVNASLKPGATEPFSREDFYCPKDAKYVVCPECDGTGMIEYPLGFERCNDCLDGYVRESVAPTTASDGAKALIAAADEVRRIRTTPGATGPYAQHFERWLRDRAAVL